MNNAWLYTKVNYPQRRDAAIVLHKYVPRLLWNWDEESVLDVGCGTGDVTAEVLLPLLPARVRRVVGADVSPAMVRHAASAHAHLLPRLRFVQADIAAADLRASPLRAEAGERGFSKIFSFYCLNWVQDQNTSFSNICQLLRSGGEAVVLIVAKTPLFNSYMKLQRNPTWLSYMQDAYDFISPYHFKSDPVEEFTTMARDIGFHVLDCHTVEQVHEYDVHYMTNVLKAVNPFVDRIPDERKDVFMKDVLREAQLEIIPSDEASQKKETICYRFLAMIAHIVKDYVNKDV